MHLLRKIKENKYFSVVFFGAILGIIYFSNVHNIFVVWEIGDEAGYLGNAAWMAGYDWSSTREVLPYFGYGYSLLLVPFFYLCDNGVMLIQAAVCINIVCILVSYLVQIKLMTQMINKCSVFLVAVIAFLVNLYPYLVASSMKVICESFLTLQYWIIALILYNALKKEKKSLFFCLGIASAFIFFIHTRSIIVVGVIFLILLYYGLHKDIDWKNLLIFFIFFSVTFILGTVIKNMCVQSSYRNLEGDAYEAVSQVNRITVKYIADRLKWLFDPSNIILYFRSVNAKAFYIITGTGMMALFGIYALVKNIFNKRKDKKKLENRGISLYFLLSFALMYIVCIVSGAGTKEVNATFFYGRYFEYTLGGLIFMGVYSCLCEYNSRKKVFYFLLITFVIGLLGKGIGEYFVSQQVYIDTARTATFSFEASINNDFSQMMYFIMIETAILGFLIIGIEKWKYRNYILSAAIFLIFLLDDQKVIDTINRTNRAHEGEKEVVEYILNSEESTPVYFVNGEYKDNVPYFSVLQVLLKNRPVILVEQEKISNIEESAFIVCYHDSDIVLNLDKNHNYIMNNHVFNLYESNKTE